MLCSSVVHVLALIRKIVLYPHVHCRLSVKLFSQLVLIRQRVGKHEKSVSNVNGILFRSHDFDLD